MSILSSEAIQTICLFKARHYRKDCSFDMSYILERWGAPHYNGVQEIYDL